MLEVVRNTYHGLNLQPGYKAQWVYGRRCYSLYRYPWSHTARLVFASPDCTKDGIKANGKQVTLAGVVAQGESKGHVLGLKHCSAHEKPEGGVREWK